MTKNTYSSFGVILKTFRKRRHYCPKQREGSQMRKYYTATSQGKQELHHVQQLIRELYQEVVEQAEGSAPQGSSAVSSAQGEGAW